MMRRCYIVILMLFIQMHHACGAPRSNNAPPFSFVVIHHQTGKVVHHQDAYARIHPASLTKMLTLYLLFEDLSAGRIYLTDAWKTSRVAAAQPASKLGLREGEKISVRHCILALTVKSANDAAYVISENLSSTRHAFMQRMNNTARRLGLKNSFFINASGLHHPNQVSTAYDMARLLRALSLRFPIEFKAYFKQPLFIFKQKIHQSHASFLHLSNIIQGGKTGYISRSGYNIAFMFTRMGVPYIAVIVGGKSARARDSYAWRFVQHFKPRVEIKHPRAIYAIDDLLAR